MSTFRDEEIDRLDRSGWSGCASIAEAVAAAGLPAPTAGYLAKAFSKRQWREAEVAVAGLRERFAGARFADEVTYGVLLVPDAARLDTRRAMAPEARREQLGRPAPDVFDARLPEGRMGFPAGPPWSLVATVVGWSGPACGSYRDVATAEAAAFTVAGVDTRTLMLRRVWGARVLQCGTQPPDCEHNARWTFTLMVGEALCDGLAESGTVLKGHVRFRLGKADRGIGSARVAPAIWIA